MFVSHRIFLFCAPSSAAPGGNSPSPLLAPSYASAVKSVNHFIRLKEQDRAFDRAGTPRHEYCSARMGVRKTMHVRVYAVKKTHVRDQLARGCYLKVERPGIKPATICVASQHPNHCTTRSLRPTGVSCSSGDMLRNKTHVRVYAVKKTLSL